MKGKALFHLMLAIITQSRRRLAKGSSGPHSSLIFALTELADSLSVTEKRPDLVVAASVLGRKVEVQLPTKSMAFYKLGGEKRRWENWEAGCNIIEKLLLSANAFVEEVNLFRDVSQQIIRSQEAFDRTKDTQQYERRHWLFICSFHGLLLISLAVVSGFVSAQVVGQLLFSFSVAAFATFSALQAFNNTAICRRRIVIEFGGVTVLAFWLSSLFQRVDASMPIFVIGLGFLLLMTKLKDGGRSGSNGARFVALLGWMFSNIILYLIAPSLLREALIIHGLFSLSAIFYGFLIGVARLYIWQLLFVGCIIGGTAYLLSVMGTDVSNDKMLTAPEYLIPYLFVFIVVAMLWVWPQSSIIDEAVLVFFASAPLLFLISLASDNDVATGILLSFLVTFASLCNMCFRLLTIK